MNVCMSMKSVSFHPFIRVLKIIEIVSKMSLERAKRSARARAHS